MRKILPLLLLLCAPLLLAQGDGKHGKHDGHGSDEATVHHRFDDVERWSKAFDDPARDAWQKPIELVAALRLQPGQAVADIGAGTGYLNRHLAAAVGEAGKVIAVDVEQSLVDHMTARATEEGTPQVQARLGAYADPKLAEAEVDLILLVDTYHHIDGRRDYFGRLRAALKPGGRLVIVDWAKGDNPVGPKDDHKIEPEQVQSELIDVGWAPLAAKPAVDLPYQYVVMFALDPAARSSAPPSE
jgi:SAM-dependent methyltransferase